MKKQIDTKNAPGAIGPYSQAIQTGDTIYVSGQLPLNAETGEFAGDTAALQTKKSLENAKAILEEAGYSMDDVVKTTVLLSDMNDFVEMNGVYAEFFSAPFPARAAFEVARLPKDALVEIELVACKK